MLLDEASAEGMSAEFRWYIMLTNNCFSLVGLQVSDEVPLDILWQLRCFLCYFLYTNQTCCKCRGQ